MSLLLLVVASSFFLPAMMTYLLDRDISHSYVVNYGKENRLTAFDEYQIRHNNVGSKAWLSATINLVEKYPAYTLILANYFKSNNKISKAKFWFQQANRAGLISAKIPLATIFYQQKEFDTAKTLLQEAYEVKESLSKSLREKTISLLLNFAIKEGSSRRIRRYSAELSVINSKSKLLADIEKYQVFAIFPEALTVNSDKNSTIESEQCVASIQFFATNIADLQYVEKLIREVKSNAIAEFSCFYPPRYMPLPRLSCDHESDSTIQCDESVWQAYVPSISAKYLGVLLPSGGAKVHNGILYLDSQDTVDVFAHELSHLFGFADEYPLPKGHGRCLSEQTEMFSYNTAVLIKDVINDSGGNISQSLARKNLLAQIPWAKYIDEQTPIFTKHENKWVIGTPLSYKYAVGLFPSETCNNSDSVNAPRFQSFKPVNERTALQYFELKFPKVYQQLLSDDPSRFLMPSYKTNIELSLLP